MGPDWEVAPTQQVRSSGQAANWLVQMIWGGSQRFEDKDMSEFGRMNLIFWYSCPFETETSVRTRINEEKNIHVDKLNSHEIPSGIFWGIPSSESCLLTLSLPLQSILEVVHGLVSRGKLGLEGGWYIAHP